MSTISFGVGLFAGIEGCTGQAGSLVGTVVSRTSMSSWPRRNRPQTTAVDLAHDPPCQFIPHAHRRRLKAVLGQPGERGGSL